MHSKVENVLRARNAAYTVHRHAAFSMPIHSPADFAVALGYELARITKTLLVRATTGERYAIVVAPMGKKIDFRALANLLGVKRVEVAPASDLAARTGYPEKGVSPLGVTGVPVFIDEGLFAFATILVGAGVGGVEIEIDPNDLAAAANAERTPLSI